MSWLEVGRILNEDVYNGKHRKNRVVFPTGVVLYCYVLEMGTFRQEEADAGVDKTAQHEMRQQSLQTEMEREIRKSLEILVERIHHCKVTIAAEKHLALFCFYSGQKLPYTVMLEKFVKRKLPRNVESVSFQKAAWRVGTD